MTDHSRLTMYHEDRRVTDKRILRAILDMSQTCTLTLHDEPYPYVVPMNFGYTWDDRLVLHLHMTTTGHRLELLRKDPFVAVNVYAYLDRAGYKSYRNERQDYRSVTVFGRAEIIEASREEEFIHGLSALSVHAGRPPIKKMTEDMRRRLLILKVPADAVTGKTQYPIESVQEVPIPENTEK